MTAIRPISALELIRVGSYRTMMRLLRTSTSADCTPCAVDQDVLDGIFTRGAVDLRIQAVHGLGERGLGRIRLRSRPEQKRGQNESEQASSQQDAGKSEQQRLSAPSAERKESRREL